MRIVIDQDERTLSIGERTIPLYSREAFEIITDEYLKVGWNEKYVYTFTWLGRPIIQLPDDMFRVQELIYSLKPDVIVETGVAHGGSLVFYASILDMLYKDEGRSLVVGVDVEIRPHNRKAIEAHPLSSNIKLIEGDSIAKSTLDLVKKEIEPTDKVMVILDSKHTKAHVLSELELYSELVTPGSYILATDGIMQLAKSVPRGSGTWINDNPAVAVEEFLAKNKDFELAVPAWKFNESALKSNVTHWQSAWLRRKV